MRSRLSLLLLSLAFLSFSCSKREDAPPVSEGVKLELKLKQGDSYILSTDINQKIEMSMNGQRMNMDQVMHFEVGMNVKEVKPGGNAVTENTFERMSMKQSMKGPMDGEIEIDTKGDVKKGMMSELLLEQFKKIVGLKYTIEFDKQGNIRTTNIGEIMSKLAPRGGKNIEESMNGSTVPFPLKPVKIGETWKGDVDKDLAGTVAKISSTYMLKEIKGDVATITVEGKINKMPEAKEIGTMSGTFDIELLTGWTSVANIKMKMDVEADQSGTKIPMKVDTDMKITSTK